MTSFRFLYSLQVCFRIQGCRRHLIDEKMEFVVNHVGDTIRRCTRNNESVIFAYDGFRGYLFHTLGRGNCNYMGNSVVFAIIHRFHGCHSQPAGLCLRVFIMQFFSGRVFWAHENSYITRVFRGTFILAVGSRSSAFA